MKKIFFLCFGLLIACNQNYVVEEIDKDFENNRWLSTDEKQFVFQIESENAYQISLHIAHVYDFQIPEIPVEVSLNKNDNVVFQKEVLVKFKDENGKDSGECLGDLCDLYFPISEKVQLTQGKYHFSVKSKFKGAYLPNILGVGVRVEK